jgi:hypothetical protein
MTSDYVSIRADNERRYGMDIGRIGPMLLAERYDDRTHFIFELLQNAEDALARRPDWNGSRAVTFVLSNATLRVSHCGRPFDERDVRGICGIAESTKGLTEIGRFGIGFKSVYAFTEHPEVHSGEEDFAIESFVWPIAIRPVCRLPEETVFVLPLRAEDDSAHADIVKGLRGLGSRSLLFLRQIEEIKWEVEGGPSGIYLRGKPENFGENVRRISLIGEKDGEPDVEETWLVFSQDVRTPQRKLLGHVEIAFSIRQDSESGQWSVQAINDSSLVVFFPTILPTYLGFLVQGPYRTTPSRDNVPRQDPSNRTLVLLTRILLVKALLWLRDHSLLDAAMLRCLPLNRAKFAEGSMFAPLFVAVRDALVSEALLPRFGAGHIAARNAKLARTQELRELFNSTQLGCLFGADGELFWLSDDITQDRTPELRQYLMSELAIAEITPETILPKLSREFLEAQSDAWILKLYEFLNGQPALLRQGRLEHIPLIRLTDGRHLTAKANGQPQAFLPSAIETDFPTVLRAACASDEARKFLQSLGLTEPDSVDDVIRNVLPKYRRDKLDTKAYATDIHRILNAFRTDSNAQREKLIAALREVLFVRAVNAGDSRTWWLKPGLVYMATERLKDLFAGVGGVFFVDETFTLLRGELSRELLQACGAGRYLQTVRFEPIFSWEECREMRRNSGCEDISGGEKIEDYCLRGLDQLLRDLPKFDVPTRRKKGALLWEALCDVESRHGASAFSGTYQWKYYNVRSTTFDAAFVRQLNETAWVPDSNGELKRPDTLVFDTLDWKPNPFLLSKIRFKSPIIETLAKEAGIEPGVLDLLTKLGLTSEAELRTRLGIKERPETAGETAAEAVSDGLMKLPQKTSSPAPTVPDFGVLPPDGTGGAGDSNTGRDIVGTRAGPDTGESAGSHPDERSSTGQDTGGTRTQGTTARGLFISYVAVGPDEEEQDPDGLDQVARMGLEEQAIQRILQTEPQLQRTPPSNPGYDLFEACEDGQPTRWIEVKAMTRDLRSRPVGLTRAQFECACEHGEAFWIYVVEHAGDAEAARIVRIQDPAGKARTFTFDHGWLHIAHADVFRDIKQVGPGLKFQ